MSHPKDYPPRPPPGKSDIATILLDDVEAHTRPIVIDVADVDGSDDTEQVSAKD